MLSKLFLFFLLFPLLFAQISTEGGNVSRVDVGVENISTERWAGVVGWMNISSPSNPSFSIYDISIPSSGIYIAWPKGSYYNLPMIVTRLPFKPTPDKFSSPSPSDFSDGGMFSAFNAFNGWNLSWLSDSPKRTFCNPCSYTTCVIQAYSYPCVYINLSRNFQMAVLKFSNGSVEEPIFLCYILNKTGYNGSIFQFEYLLPAKEVYSFYVYPPECNITVFIDGVATSTFPSSANVYALRARVVSLNGSPVSHSLLFIIERGGQNLFHPSFLSRSFFSQVAALTNASGEAIFAVAPTKYNIPFNYSIYLLSLSPYCKKELFVANYSFLFPRYRRSLINDEYEASVKTAVQNMNALSSIASKWIEKRKMRKILINISINGSYTVAGVLKIGAPNLINITLYNNSYPVVGKVEMVERDGHVIVVPYQPEKLFFSTNVSFLTNNTVIVIPTKYNTNASFVVRVYHNYFPVATITIPYDTLLEEPSPSEEDMPLSLYSPLSLNVQNINAILSTMGKDISTIP